jgi:hypothetical protein
MKTCLEVERNWGAAMKVRELVAMLAKADPDDTVAIDADAKCLLELNRGVPRR